MVTHNFQNASNFTITGGQFGTVLGNINNFAYNVPDVFDIATKNPNPGNNPQILPPPTPSSPSSSSHKPSSPLSNNLHVDPKPPSPLGLELEDLQSSPQSPLTAAAPSLVDGKQTPPEEAPSSDKNHSPLPQSNSPHATYNHNVQPSLKNEMATHFYLLQSGNIPLPSTSTSLISSSPQSYTTPTRMQINPPSPSLELQILNPSPNTVNHNHCPGPGLFGTPNINQSQPIPTCSPPNTHYTNESPIFAYHPPSTSSHHTPLPHTSIPDYTTIIPSSIPIGGGGGSNSFPSLPFPRHHRSHHQYNPQSYGHYQRPITPLPRHSYTITMPEPPQTHYNSQIDGYQHSQLTRHQQQNYSPTNGYINTNHWTPIQVQNNSSMNMGDSHEYTLPVPLPVVPTPTLNQGYGDGSGSGSVYGGSRYEHGTRRF